MSFENFTHLTDFEIDAKWWLPSSPERIIPGRLVYRKAGELRIELMGTLGADNFEPGSKTVLDLLRTYDVVLGATVDGRPCTVLDARETSAPVLRGDFGKCHLQVRRLFLGGHFPRRQEIKFQEQRVQFTYLERWLGIDPIVQNWSRESQMIELLIPMKPKEVLRVDFQCLKTTVTVTLGASFGDSGEVFTTRRKGAIQIRPEEPQTLEWYEHLIMNLRNFLTLATGKPIFARKITGTPFDGSAAEETRSQWVEVFMPLYDAEELNDLSWVEMPVPFRILSEKAAQIIANWFAYEEKLKPIVGLLLTTYYNAEMYVEAEFLTLIQVLEIYHRRLVGGSYLSSEEWEPHRTALVSEIPHVLESGHRAALQNRIKYGYEYSLRKRLGDMLQSLNDVTAKHLTRNYGDFPAQCAETRNLLIHEGGGGILGDGLAALWKTNQRLRALIHILMWKHLGLPEKTISTQIFTRVLRV